MRDDWQPTMRWWITRSTALEKEVLALRAENIRLKAELASHNPPEEEKSFAENFAESARWVVDMMNRGGANPDQVYPKGRYQGD